MENQKLIYILYKKRSLDKKSQYWTQFSITHRIFLGIKSFSFSRCKDQSTTITWSGERLPNQYFLCLRILRILKIWKRFMILRIYQGLNTCNLLEYMHFSLFAWSTLCSYRWMRYFPLSQIHIVDGDRWGCLWLFVCFLYFLGLLFWRCISLERDFRAVHILRNHFWGSERPPPHVIL